MTAEEKALVGKIYDIQGFSVHDGPGIRTTVFEKGCPLKCMWCHSPESQGYHDQLCWFEMRCIGIEKCGRCLTACPHNAISPGKVAFSMKDQCDIQYVKVDRSKCDECAQCAVACTSTALFMSGKDYTVQEVVDRVVKDKPYFKRSGGGVTVSGGECLTQPDFTVALLKALKEVEIHTAVDTTGFVKYDVIKRTIPYTDLYLYDLKHMDSKRHQDATGVPCELIKENALKLAADGGKFQIRIPIIPGYNDTEENIRETCELCVKMNEAKEGAIEIVQILPYHKMGSMKYTRLDWDNPMPDIEPPSNEHMEEIKALIESYGLPCKIH